MGRVIELTTGIVIRGETDDELVALVEAYLRENHPHSAGRLSRTEILAMAVEDRMTREVDDMGKTAKTAIDEEKLGALLGTFVNDAGAAFMGVLHYVGDDLGLYKTLASNGPSTAAALAAKAGTNERMTREWLLAHAAGGYVTYDAASDSFSLSPEQAATLADEDSAVFLAGLFQSIMASYQTIPKLIDAFKTGKGLTWSEQHPNLFVGTERFFRPGYRAHLVQEWIPALDGVDAKLRAGARVADVGCGHGASTIIMAQAYPSSTFVGYDYHPASVEHARRAAKEAGVDDRVTFEVARGSEIPDGGYDLITFFDCVHDMGDPSAAARRAREALAAGGSLLLVEPNSQDAPADNFNPVGRLFYAASTLICTPCSLHEDGPALGAQAGREPIRRLFTEAGFTSVRAAHETPFNIVYEITP